MTHDPWHVDSLDLDAYLAVVGQRVRPVSLDALGDLHTAHVRAFPFENLDVLLGQHPGVRLDAVADKLVVRRRGGYCFEHATLFSAVLERLGYAVRRHLGRVGDPASAGRTHMVVVVDLDDARWLCDPGFGMSLLRPIRLEDGAEHADLAHTGGGWRYRVRRADAAWELQRLREHGWEVMHTTDELPVHPVDVVMGHHFTSTFPGSHFTTGLMITRHLEDRHVTVTHETLTVRRPDAPTEHRALQPGELSTWFGRLGVTLPSVEADALVRRFERG